MREVRSGWPAASQALSRQHCAGIVQLQPAVMLNANQREVFLDKVRSRLW